MTAAIFALAGVIVGGLLQGFMADLLERRRARRDARAAARLLHVAMLESSVQLTYTIGDDGWPAIIGRQLVPDEWMEHREVLARTLDGGAWLLLVRGIMALRRMERLARDVPEPEATVGPEARREVQDAFMDVAAASHELARYTDVPDDEMPPHDVA